MGCPMEQESTTRKLAAILSADVKEYSQLQKNPLSPPLEKKELVIILKIFIELICRF